MDIDTIIDAITKGELDDDLTLLENVIDDRQKAQARIAFHRVKVGDKVTLQNLRPKYMVGAPATVVGKNRERIVIDVDDAFLARNPGCRYRKNVTVTPDMIVPV